MRSRIARIDGAVLPLAAHLRSRNARLPRMLLLALSHSGDGYLWVALLIVALWLRHFKAAEMGACASGLAALLFLSAKQFWKRTRPQGASHWGTWIAPDRFSFPSGHTAIAVAIASSAYHYWPELAWVLWTAAAAVAISRVLLGFHYLSDVLAGACIGLFSGVVCRTAIG